MDYRQATPPSTSVHVEDYDFQCTGGSASTASFYPNDWSPASMMTAASTPPRSRSPSKAREIGPLLLPRVRAQDQYIGGVPIPAASITEGRSRSIAMTFLCSSVAIYQPLMTLKSVRTIRLLTLSYHCLPNLSPSKVHTSISRHHIGLLWLT
jgi:hypothetical protein